MKKTSLKNAYLNINFDVLNSFELMSRKQQLNFSLAELSASGF
jgi:hypothetical protein